MRGILRGPVVFAAIAGLVCPQFAKPHGAVLYSPVAPIHVAQRGLFDSTGRPIILAGVQMRGLEVFSPTPVSRAQVDAMTTLTFRIIRRRWNLNTVRLPISPWVWQRDGDAYFDLIVKTVNRAGAEGLWTVLVAADDARAGSPLSTSLPGSEVERFWTACAAKFKDSPMVIFSLYSKPSAQLVPGATAGARTSADWNFWRNGGTALNGQRVVGMQQLATRIREAGAKQLISAPAFNDVLDFRGFDTPHLLSDENVMYEVYPYFDHALTDIQRNSNFGFLGARVPLYAGEWGTPLNDDSPSCRSVPGDVNFAPLAVLDLLNYMTNQSMSWTAASFEPGSMLQNVESFEPTRFDRGWTCGVSSNPQPGMGSTILEWGTGDAHGFGSLLPELIANAAGNRAGPLAPGEILSLFGQGLGPDNATVGAVTTEGKLSVLAGDTRVLFDGIAAPIFATGAFQVTVQVPYEVAGRPSVVVQGFYLDVPSNPLTMPVVEAFPGLFTAPGTQDVLALDQDGNPNSGGAPAAAGSVVALFASGLGQTSPAGLTGQLAVAPFRNLARMPVVRIGGLDAEVLYAGEAPGLIGVAQVNVRVPAALADGSEHQVPVVLSVGDRSSLTTRLWVR